MHLIVGSQTLMALDFTNVVRKDRRRGVGYQRLRKHSNLRSEVDLGVGRKHRQDFEVNLLVDGMLHEPLVRG